MICEETEAPLRLRAFAFYHLQLLSTIAAARFGALAKSVCEDPGEVRDRYGFALAGYAAMPEHIHLLIGEPATGTPSTVMQVLKQRVSRRRRKRKGRRVAAAQLPLRFRGGDAALPQFWQRRVYDFNVWSHKKKVEKLEYMHLNPVKRHLVEHPRDWPWSSYASYATGEPGLTRVDSV
jgi:REP element-mobilizing transposase RayT